MNTEPTAEELMWMLSVYRGEFRIMPRHVVQGVIARGLGIPNLGGAFNLTARGRAMVRGVYGLHEPQQRGQVPLYLAQKGGDRRAVERARPGCWSGYEKILKMFCRNS